MTSALQPYLNTRRDSTYRFLGAPTLVRATAETTNGKFCLIEQWDTPPGFATPLHMHNREDESFYVIEGEVAVICGGKWLKAGPGAFVFGPQGIPHGFRVIGNSPANLLVLCAPAGFEGFVLGQTTPLSEPPSPPDMGKLMALAARYGVDILGPLPDTPADL